MALNATKGTITAPTGAANQTSTVNLAAGFDLKAVILWATNSTSEALTDGDAAFCHGYATNDGGSIQMLYQSTLLTDAAGSSNTACGMNTTACIKTYSVATTPTVDSIATCTTFSSTQFVLTWTDAPGTAIIVHYLALGGSDITAARCGAYLSTATATQDVTINTGFGQPDLLFQATTLQTTLTDGTAGRACLGIAKSDTSRRTSVFTDQDAANTMFSSSWQGARAVVGVLSAGTVDLEGDLSAKAAWPTDGFEMSWPNTGGYQVGYLALKGTFTSTIGSNTAPTAAAPQTQDLAHSATPDCALLWGVPVATVAGADTTGTDLGGFFIGGWDGTNEGVAGITSKDNDGTSSTGRFHSTAKAIQEVIPVASGANPPTLASEANASVNGANVRLSWNDTDTIAREYGYLILSGTSETPTPGGTTTGGTGPTAATGLTISGPTAGGTGPTAAVTFDPGGATAGGTGPAEPAPSNTPIPGGAAAGGVGPAAAVDLALAGATSGGSGGTGGTTIAQAGTTADGIAPTPATALTLTGAISDGRAVPSVAATVGTGGVNVGGFIEDPLQEHLPQYLLMRGAS